MKDRPVVDDISLAAEAYAELAAVKMWSVTRSKAGLKAALRLAFVRGAAYAQEDAMEMARERVSVLIEEKLAQFEGKQLKGN